MYSFVQILFVETGSKDSSPEIPTTMHVRRIFLGFEADEVCAACDNSQTTQNGSSRMVRDSFAR